MNVTLITPADKKSLLAFVNATIVAVLAKKITLKGARDVLLNIKLDDEKARGLVRINLRNARDAVVWLRESRDAIEATVAHGAGKEKVIRNGIEAMVDIIERSEGKGRGYASEYKAYSVMRVDADVMVITRDVAKVLTFASPFQSMRHGTMYRQYSICGVAMYADERGADAVRSVELAKARGDNLFWMTQHGASLTSHQRPHEFYLELLPGQKIQFDGVLLEVQPAANGNLKLVEVK